MSILREQMIQDMQLRGFSPRTQDSYARAVRKLAEHYHKSPDLVADEELRQYFLHRVCLATIYSCGSCQSPDHHDLHPTDRTGLQAGYRDHQPAHGGPVDQSCLSWRTSSACMARTMSPNTTTGCFPATGGLLRTSAPAAPRPWAAICTAALSATRSTTSTTPVKTVTVPSVRTNRSTAGSISSEPCSCPSRWSRD